MLLKNYFFFTLSNVNINSAPLPSSLFTEMFSPMWELRQFVEFLDEHHVNDLHCGNWGYDDNRLVLTDYAGFGEFKDRSDLKCYVFR